MRIPSRALVTDQSTPQLKKHVRLHFDKVRNAWALLAPEKVLWPDEISLSILKLCDGSMSVDAMVNGLATEFEADRQEVRDDVRQFLQEWSDRALVTL